MFESNRRRFLQSTSLLLAGGYASSLFGDETFERPEFAAEPSFDPTALFCTWQRDPTTTMTIQWIGDEHDAESRPLWYAKDREDIWRQQPHAARRFPMTDKWVFRAEITGLQPDTTYRFRVGLDSAEQEFRTMPAKATQAIQFVSGGDAGIGTHTIATNKLAAAQQPQFVVIGGDIAYENGRNPGIFYTFMKYYSRDLRDGKRLIPLLGCLGNHEVDGSYGQPREKAPFFYALFDGLYPEGGYASLDFGDYLSLVFLDTEHTTPIAGEQTDWLAKTLKQREELDTVFVFNHVPAYPSYRPYNPEEEGSGTGAGNRKHWVPLFERYNVDAVFEHHDHAYKRTHPLLDGRPGKNGVLYLGDGSWGRIRTPHTPEERPYLAVSDEAYHLSVHRIEGSQRFHVALSDTGRVVDVCATSKRAHRRG